MIKFILAFLFVGVTQISQAQEQILSYDNFHEVEAGKFYRSAQLSAGDLEMFANTYGIQTVINLRGENPNEEWYRNEEAITRRLGLKYVNISMSATRIPSRENLNQLLDSFENMPRPILVHCQAGADRTGEASALYQMLYMGKSKDQALKMLTPQYGHFNWVMPAKRYFIRDLWQGIEWARHDYEPCSGKYKYYDTNGSECH